MFKRQRTQIVSEHTPLEILHQFVAKMNIYPNNKNSSLSFNSVLNSYISYLKVLHACVGVKIHLIELNHIFAPVEAYPQGRKTFLYFKCFKYYFKASISINVKKTTLI